MTSAAVPVVETGRLRLRAHRIDDFDAARAMWADPAVVRFISGKPSTPQQTWMRLLAYAGHWSLLDFGYWAIADRATDAFLGEIGFADFKRDFAPSCAGIPELGWALATHATARGIATEAARAACAWGDARFECERTVCLIDTRNVASLGVARKCGYEAFDRTERGGVETLLLARARGARG
jgi:RimJ/RimL family protein N-acetyltransferase